jgi:hypothetical protein
MRMYFANHYIQKEISYRMNSKKKNTLIDRPVVMRAETVLITGCSKF